MFNKRSIEKKLENTLNTRPLVYLNGPRQAGKSTLAQNIKTKESNYISFDSTFLLASAQNSQLRYNKNNFRKHISGVGNKP